MRICLIGNFSGDLEEGYRNIAFNLSKMLSRKHEVLNMDIKSVFSTQFWNAIKEFDPSVLHYLTAPTISSFIVVKLVKRYCNNNAKLIISSLHPCSLKLLRNPFLRRFVSLIKPDLILTQSYEVEAILKKIKCNIKFLPNGVDTERFVPASKDVKEELREKYGIDKEKFVILHVGHLREVRGLQIFNKIQKEDENNQVIIVGSSYFKKDEDLYETLKNNGCLIWNSYFENIEEIYALSDCYVFPVTKGNSIFMPLSVMEAMACNLPVITTKFEGLNRCFIEGNGLIFANNVKIFYKKLEKIKKNSSKIKTQEKILPYSWSNIIKNLEKIYHSLSQ